MVNNPKRGIDNFEVFSLLLASEKNTPILRMLKSQENSDEYSIEDCNRIAWPYGRV